MIAVDTSALMAVLLREPAADTCRAVLEEADELIISAGTLAEALIVAGHRNIAEEMAALVEGLAVTVVAVTPAAARRVADAYARWGKGRHAAALNFGDCFAYDLAKEHDCPLLFVGDDFSRTDLRPALER
ncbi:type II toxin-antitoxin system VapC family toxin [Bosea caraganae]|uniref:Ribonuclease VapC n=1 Tax=Bosea caraganae TaxID=2763117 RepID=A0A370LBU5_9HYPH|nr:type II toxin-antitoxin system VapC family toxin [Bosea caraganae]RDJ27355.1 type II toxin-antitoxin system VapC family toxin [Bosea caraganae]RDJ29371.1 type II toxin-antitoxin system VapC family toxin [Bosea caraganae]